ncbi:putative urease accessory protein [Phaeoacremonium minimum UCRPA7]|uniref:Putative urease accessory protein n=1 Tax=Phaeoacremonium minimum (strain UCR-PA7) TaxID=1286976 RepID=R8BHF2_PHAM7|nr:putative urease accessory protein [Phaeoacremonium minimum UCRPA7]EON98672.1 putative urease accessory protein [Phaeoacremonium minimum UCRPA7]
MLGWVMKRGLEAATGAPPPVNPDDTQIEQPDTPAPVFAARAFKTALFGTPAARDQVLEEADNNSQAKTAKDDDDGFKSPTKPAGILLTPGTGTTRRKRVSFGRDVKDHKTAIGAKDDGTSKLRPRTKLTEALENARKQRNRPAKADGKIAESQAKDPEDAWEEVDDLEMDADITVDLNEPHSQSGRYWKSEFQKYHEEAKAEMEKLVKYKHLAKSYAKMKDAEALNLNQKLREEQEKVSRMEGKVTELAGRLATQRLKGSSSNDEEMMEDLARQTALAVQYREQVEELESLLKTGQIETGECGKRRRQVASPRTAKTLLDTQRELRKAREQVKELDRLRGDVQRLKADLRSAEQRELKLEVEHKRIAADLSKSTSKIAELEGRLKRSEEECERKDGHLQKLKADYNTLKENAKARYAEAREVLNRKNEEIDELKNEIRSLKTSDAEILKHDIKSLTSKQHDSNARSKKLVDLQAKLKAEQDARQRENEDASITINRLEMEVKDRTYGRASDRRGAGKSSSLNLRQNGSRNSNEGIGRTLMLESQVLQAA